MHGNQQSSANTSASAIQDLKTREAELQGIKSQTKIAKQRAEIAKLKAEKALLKTTMKQQQSLDASESLNEKSEKPADSIVPENPSNFKAQA